MEQHATPQNVTSYQFRLIGDMTVKQFAELAAGILLAWLIISSKFIVVIKWPLGLGAAFFGFALAFLPYEERPLDEWIKNFVLGLLKPTLYIWQKKAVVLSPLPDQGKIVSKQPTGNRQVFQKKLYAYLDSINQPKTLSPLDQNEENKLRNIENMLFSVNKIKKSSLSPKLKPDPSDFNSRKSAKTNSGIRVRKLRPAQDINKATIVWQKKEKESFSKTPKDKVSFAGKKETKPENLILQPVQEVGDIVPPVTQAPAITPPLKVKSLYSNKKVSRASFMQQMQMPITPDQANVLAGMVVDFAQRGVPNAIIEIKNNNNETVRALKSNKLGQFFTATPMQNNHYRLLIEHPSWDFDIIDLELKGELVPPLKIIAKRKDQA